MCLSLCVRGWRDYRAAFILSREKDGSPFTVVPPIPDHSLGISGVAQPHWIPGFKLPSAGPKSSEPLTFSELFSFPPTHLFHPFGGLSVPELPPLRGVFLMWENSRREGYKADITENEKNSNLGSNIWYLWAEHKLILNNWQMKNSCGAFVFTLPFQVNTKLFTYF